MTIEQSQATGVIAEEPVVMPARMQPRASEHREQGRTHGLSLVFGLL